ncbi:MAG: SMI1/KNR4 family protein [Chlamydiia bacterium]|nr:SMI1/KNR4 family protein [Chlamydiia bacterium]
MNELVRRYLREGENFEEVWMLDETSEKEWKDVKRLIPHFPKGWFELSRVNAADRIDFTRDFWMGRLPFYPALHAAIEEFFDALDDVCVVAARDGDSWLLQLIYSFRDNSCFFRGMMPASEEELSDLGLELNLTLPKDWVGFMKIHNGFGKLGDLALLPIDNIPDARQRVMQMVRRAEEPLKSGAMFVDTGSLIPFYETFGLNSFQCFFADWYPGSEMGNVYFSGIDYTVSDTGHREEWEENGAFATFSEWLVSYLAGMDVAL